MRKLEELRVVTSECSCSTCVGYCETRPCWPTPTEAKALIDAGFGDRLMVDWWEGGRYDDDDENIYLLCPAGKGLEGQQAYDMPGLFGGLPAMPCTFLSSGKCDLHTTDLKPTEGRMTNHEKGGDSRFLHEAIAEAWNTPEAQALFHTWKAQYGK